MKRKKTSSEKKPSSEANATLSDTEKKALKRKNIALRWGGHDSLVSDGFVPVARNFLKFAALLPKPLSPAEQLFVLNLMFHKWDGKRPYPSYATLAKRMGISVQYARDIARKLERKDYMSREVRSGRSNRFDLQPLFDALDQHITVVKATPKQEESAKAQSIPF